MEDEDFTEGNNINNNDSIDTKTDNTNNNNIMFENFIDILKNKKKVKVNGNEFEIISFYGEPDDPCYEQCLMRINGRKVLCYISAENMVKDGYNPRINISTMLFEEQKIPLKINNNIIETGGFYINSDFSLSELKNSLYKNNTVFLPLQVKKSNFYSVYNTNFYDFDKQTQKITGTKNSTSLEVAYNNYDFCNNITKEDTVQSKAIKNLLKQIRTDFLNENDFFSVVFSPDPEQQEEENDELSESEISDSDEEQDKINDNKIIDKKKNIDKNKNKMNNDNIIENKIDENMAMVCCSTDEKMIFFKINKATNMYEPVKTLTKQPYVKANGKRYNRNGNLFINNDFLYCINKKLGFLDVYSLKTMEKTTTIKLSEDLCKDCYALQRLNARDMSFIDKKTFENKLKEYMLKNCVSNNIDTINNNSNVNGLNSVQNKKTKCTIF